MHSRDVKIKLPRLLRMNALMFGQHDFLERLTLCQFVQRYEKLAVGPLRKRFNLPFAVHFFEQTKTTMPVK